MKLNTIRDGNILDTTKLILMLVTVISVIAELLFFPSWAGVIACLMMIISHGVFTTFVLKRWIVIHYPFAFIIAISMFAYRYVPVPGTLISFRPVTYGMERPIKTFIYETMFFLLFVLIFRLSCRKNRKSILKNIYKKVGLFSNLREGSIWAIGLIGLSVRIFSFATTGRITIGTVNSFAELQYAPIVLLFPSLYTVNYKQRIAIRKTSVWIYIVIISLINFGANSRADVIAPFVMYIILYYICLVREDIDVRKILNKKMVVIVIATFLVLTVMQRLSNAMLLVRNYRDDISISELISTTMDYAVNYTEDIGRTLFAKEIEAQPYSKGWTEEYIDNFALNRYGNIRISDEVFYMAETMTPNTKRALRRDLACRILCIYPQPIIDLLGINLKKNDYNYSSGDFFYYKSGYGTSTSLGGRRVTSYLPDGLALFGEYYIPLQSALFLISFFLINGLVYTDERYQVRYSMYGLFSLCTFLSMGMNSSGIYNTIAFCLRGFWEGAVVYILASFIPAIMSKTIHKKRRRYY